MRELEISTGNSVYCTLYKKQVDIEVCVAGCGSGVVSGGYVLCSADDWFAAEMDRILRMEAKRRYGNRRFESRETGGHHGTEDRQAV